MKKIAIITPGVLPVPATKGGAVENLVEILLNENEKNPHFKFTVFSVADGTAKQAAKKYTHSRFHFIKASGLYYRISRIIRALINRFSQRYFGNKFIASVLKSTDFSVFDAVILENVPQYVIPLRKKYSNIPILSHLHNRYVFNGIRYQSAIVRATTSFFCVSKYICEEVKTCEGITAPNVHCLYNGLDTHRFSQKLSAEERARMRAALKIKEDDFVFLFSGRVVPHKGTNELIRAFEIVRQRNPQKKLKLLIIGAGTTKTDFSSEEKSLIFSGYVNYHEIWKFLNLGDCAVLPSTGEEAFGLTCAECLCAGLPTIITNAGGMVEIPTNESAIIVSRGENLPQRLANAMEELLHNPEKRIAMSTSARERGASFSIERYWARFCELTERALS